MQLRTYRARLAYVAECHARASSSPIHTRGSYWISNARMNEKWADSALSNAIGFASRDDFPHPMMRLGRNI